jgi:hypothetical protein
MQLLAIGNVIGMAHLVLDAAFLLHHANVGNGAEKYLENVARATY